MPGEEEVFPVRRRPIAWIGYGAAVFAALGLLILIFGPEERGATLAATLVAAGIAWFALRSFRNVREIRIGTGGIRFLPVDARLAFDDIAGLRVPDWLDRPDTPPNALNWPVLRMKAPGQGMVPGAWVRAGHDCRLYLFGTDSDRILDAIRRRLDTGGALAPVAVPGDRGAGD